MAVGRQFAGPFVHRLQPLGMLLGSAILSAAGLFLMSQTRANAVRFGDDLCLRRVLLLAHHVWDTPTNDSPRLGRWDWPLWVVRAC